MKPPNKNFNHHTTNLPSFPQYKDNTIPPIKQIKIITQNKVFLDPIISK